MLYDGRSCASNGSFDAKIFCARAYISPPRFSFALADSSPPLEEEEVKALSLSPELEAGLAAPFFPALQFFMCTRISPRIAGSKRRACMRIARRYFVPLALSFGQQTPSLGSPGFLPTISSCRRAIAALPSALARPASLPKEWS